MTLDGTLFVDPAGQPWMVYAHEHRQKHDGTMEALPLADEIHQAALAASATASSASPCERAGVPSNSHAAKLG